MTVLGRLKSSCVFQNEPKILGAKKGGEAKIALYFTKKEKKEKMSKETRKDTILHSSYILNQTNEICY